MFLKLAAINKKWNISKDNQNSFFFRIFFFIDFLTSQGNRGSGGSSYIPQYLSHFLVIM